MDNRQYNFDPETGEPIKKNNETNQTPTNINANSNLEPTNNYNQPPKKPNLVKIILTIIGGFILLAIVIILITSLTSKKLVCESSKGSITLMYKNQKLTGYKGNGISFDIEGQQKIVDRIGMDSYLKQFDVWFKNTTGGTCK